LCCVLEDRASCMLSRWCARVLCVYNHCNQFQMQKISPKIVRWRHANVKFLVSAWFGSLVTEPHYQEHRGSVSSRPLWPSIHCIKTFLLCKVKFTESTPHKTSSLSFSGQFYPACLCKDRLPVCDHERAWLWHIPHVSGGSQPPFDIKNLLFPERFGIHCLVCYASVW
jgi:hypothetical protein